MWHQKLPKGLYSIFIVLYYKQNFSHFGVEVFATPKWKTIQGNNLHLLNAWDCFLEYFLFICFPGRFMNATQELKLDFGILGFQ